jgi:hypothetical protein
MLKAGDLVWESVLSIWQYLRSFRRKKAILLKSSYQREKKRFHLENVVVLYMAP